MQQIFASDSDANNDFGKFEKNDIIGASEVLMEITTNDFEPGTYMELELDVHARLT